MTAPQYWYDGQLQFGREVALPLNDPGWLYGATVFTTLRVYENALDHPWTAWNAHLERTQRSLHAFHWSIPDWAQLRQGAELLAPAYPVLRITLFPDGRGLIWGRPLPPDLSQLQMAGITAWVADSPDYSRPLPGHKTGNYLGCWLALEAARRAGAQEAILLNAAGHWLETSTGNLWGWANGLWYTPPLATGILPGVLRSRLLQGFQAQGQVVEMSPWSADRVHPFTALAYTNSVMEVIPIHTVLRGTAQVNYNPDHDLIQQLTAAWQSVAG